MFCPNCGMENDNNNFRCVNCSAIIQPVDRGTGYYKIEDDPGMRMLLPVGRSMIAIAAGYAGLFAILIFPAPIALLLGISAVIHIRKHPEKKGMGRAIFAIIMGVIFSLPLLLFLLAAISEI